MVQRFLTVSSFDELLASCESTLFMTRPLSLSVRRPLLWNATMCETPFIVFVGRPLLREVFWYDSQHARRPLLCYAPRFDTPLLTYCSITNRLEQTVVVSWLFPSRGCSTSLPVNKATMGKRGESDCHHVDADKDLQLQNPLFPYSLLVPPITSEGKGNQS